MTLKDLPSTIHLHLFQSHPTSPSTSLPHAVLLFYCQSPWSFVWSMCNTAKSSIAKSLWHPFFSSWAATLESPSHYFLRSRFKLIVCISQAVSLLRLSSFIQAINWAPRVSHPAVSHFEPHACLQVVRADRKPCTISIFSWAMPSRFSLYWATTRDTLASKLSLFLREPHAVAPFSSRESSPLPQVEPLKLLLSFWTIFVVLVS